MGVHGKPLEVQDHHRAATIHQLWATTMCLKCIKSGANLVVVVVVGADG